MKRTKGTMERRTKNINGVICYVGEHKEHDEDVPAEMTTDAVRDVLTSLFAYEEAEEKRRLARIPENTPDIDFTHLFELIMADAEKRVVVLPCKVGDTVWIIERDEDGAACDYSGYMFLCATVGAVICTPFIGGLGTTEETIQYLIEETAENYDAHLSVFPANDIYLTKEEAAKALKKALKRETT